MGARLSTLPRSSVQCSNEPQRNIGKCKELERKYYKSIMLFNLWEVFNSIRLVCEEMNFDLSSHKVNVDIVFRHWYNTIPIASEIASELKIISEDLVLRDYLKKSQRVSMAQNADFFLDNIERILSKDYIPSGEDILNSYATTVGTDYANYNTANAYITFSVQEESVTVFSDLATTSILNRAHFMIVFNKKDAFDAHHPHTNGAPPGETCDGAQTNDIMTMLSMIRSKFLTYFTKRKIYQHTTTLINDGNLLQSNISENINLIARRNRLPSAS
ncbi:unnamed protein product [Anisakis simplex]|uniref:Guanine nucleotide-binding protein alpha-14 subunit (inferred by orthology to a C. elegans protein) n=1 Tax=Anisakis simplex TaxID=6269 RepID=A0A0M3K166_ANISI|nr:unnamed protein product [Anisakis simplex]